MKGASILREMVRREIRRDSSGRAHVLGLSGGKDSTALAILMREEHPEIPMTYICTPTGDELPEMMAHWEKLERLLGRPIHHLVNRDEQGRVVTLNRLIEHFGALPNYRMRWCTRMLKIQPTEKFMKRLGKNAVMYVGLRADEPTREGLFNPDIEVRFPLREHGMDEAAVWAFLREREQYQYHGGRTARVATTNGSWSGRRYSSSIRRSSRTPQSKRPDTDTPSDPPGATPGP